MRAYDDMLIRVHAQWNGWRNAEVRVGDLHEVYWFQPGGAPQAIVHGYISCSNIVSGDIPHDCKRRSPAHRLLVCILKRHAIPGVYAELARRADETRSGIGRTRPLDRARSAAVRIQDPRLTRVLQSVPKRLGVFRDR